MPETLDAIFENGVLRPLQPTHFKENQKVRLTVSYDSESVIDDLIDYDLMEEAGKLADHTVTLEQVRKALAVIPGSLDEDFAAEREERFVVDQQGIHWGRPDGSLR